LSTDQDIAISRVRQCPALFVTAPASNQGKTTVTAGIARYHRERGRKVRVFKTGPDFLDPMILERASGNPVEQLDLWMAGEDRCRQLLFEAAADADLILIEGVMGLFDGCPSSADLAEMLDIPILIVISAASMAQTFHAVSYGLAKFRPALRVFGSVANHVASLRHAEMIQKSKSATVPYLGCIKRGDDLKLPDRHLGLLQAFEINDLEIRLNTAATAMFDAGLTDLPQASKFELVECKPVPLHLKGVSIAIAKDEAFSFLYRGNVEILESMGAQIKYFSPLAGHPIPDADAVYLPGGYPELHLSELGRESDFKQSIKKHFSAGKPIYAECGGMLVALDSLTDKSGIGANMLGLLPGSAVMQKKLVGLGYQEIDLPTGCIRGHTFHHSLTNSPVSPALHARRQSDGSQGEAVYQKKRLWASYVHLYFPSNPETAASLFKN
jgi:cobyrinic acid a,c-diamide synthase